jgi:hypothetical protein
MLRKTTITIIPLTLLILSVLSIICLHHLPLKILMYGIHHQRRQIINKNHLRKGNKRIIIFSSHKLLQAIKEEIMISLGKKRNLRRQKDKEKLFMIMFIQTVEVLIVI